MTQLPLAFRNSETPIHRERDRPKQISLQGWSAFLDDVCLRGGVSFTHQGLLRVLWKVAPEHQAVDCLKKLTAVHLMAIETAVERGQFLASEPA
jgi:hypothetical protein